MLACGPAAKANHGAFYPVFMCAPAALSHVLDASQMGVKRLGNIQAFSYGQAAAGRLLS